MTPLKEYTPIIPGNLTCVAVEVVSAHRKDDRILFTDIDGFNHSYHIKKDIVNSVIEAIEPDNLIGRMFLRFPNGTMCFKNKDLFNQQYVLRENKYEIKRQG